MLYLRRHRTGMTVSAGMIMLPYDIKFRITLFDMTESLPCVLLFLMYFFVLTQIAETNFQIFQFRILTSQRYSHFLLWKVCNRLKLKRTCYFSFGKRVLFKFDFCLLALFFASGTRTFNIDETDSIVFIRSVYLFILPTNTIDQVTRYMHY